MSQKHEIVEKATALTEPLATAEGLELVDIEWVNEGGWILRVFIDKPGATVGLEECQALSRVLETALDVEDFIPQHYTLEVSSPGVNRPLTKPQHFQKALGQQVKVKTFGPIGDPPRKNFSGTLVGFEAGAAQVEVEGAGRFSIPLELIAKAHIEYDFSADLKKKPQHPTNAE
ncbi:MAG: ribosome maturation factor RimP [Deltaproteobacteria bacterium]|nr:ribosome maturation factor RimP [Deltaproteobacteria bacterium]